MIQKCVSILGKRDESTYPVGEYCRKFGEVLIALDLDLQLRCAIRPSEDVVSPLLLLRDRKQCRPSPRLAWFSVPRKRLLTADKWEPMFGVCDPHSSKR